jgi:hypothetical protein
LKGDGPEIKIEDDSGPVIQMYAADDTAYTGTSSAHPYNLWSGGNVAVTITNDLNVGIGTTSPWGELDVRDIGTDSVSNIISSTFNDQEAYGPEIWFVKSHNDDGTTLTTTLNTELLGRLSFYGVDSENDQDVGAIIDVIQDGVAGTSVPTTMYLRTYSSTGANTNQLVLASDGNVGIGMNPSVELDVTGNIEYTGSITGVSDERLKENITDITNALNTITALRGRTFNMLNTTNVEYGLVAQEVQSIVPEAVSVTDIENGYLGVSYLSFTPILIEAVKELKAENDQKNSEIQQLKQLICPDHPEAEICNS